MKRVKKIKERVLSAVLTFVMVVALFVGLPAMDVSAASFKTPIVDKSSITLYSSGCLKSITITVQAAGSYATAYGRVGVHTGTTAYNWDNRFVKSSSCSSWPAESEFVSRDSTFVAFASGSEFLWTDCQPHTITFTFADGKVDLSKNQTYHLYLWTRAYAYGIYTDAHLGTLKTEDGKLMDGSGNTLAENTPHTHTLEFVPAKTATCTADGNTEHYKCTGCDDLFADENGVTPTTAEQVKLASPGHDLSEATCEDVASCKRDDCEYTEGTPLGHDLSDATCEDAPKCKRDGCEYTEGEALGHDLSDATCEDAPKCKRDGCEYTEGTSLGHNLSKATCVDKGVCSVCGNAYGDVDSTNHVGDTETKDAKKETCGDDGYTGDIYCKSCTKLAKEGTTIKATGEHRYGEWKVVKEATQTVRGEKQRTCSVCGHVDSKKIPALSEVPATGDDSNVVLYGSVFTVSFAALVVLFFVFKKRKQTH